MKTYEISNRLPFLYCWVYYARYFCFVVVIASLSMMRLSAQVAFPNFSIIGRGIGGEMSLWSATNALTLPRQMAIDYSHRGQVYGFKCEYLLSTNVFQELRLSVGKELEVPEKVNSNNVIVWRSDSRKVSVMLEQVPEDDAVLLIVISIDKAVRD